MSEQELYEIARARIQRRNRRWILWSLDLGVLILTLAGLILAGGSQAAVTIFMGWVAIFVTHTIITGFLESTEGSIENEVVKLRNALYEKPKHRDASLRLSEDGELVELEDWEQNDAQRSRNSTRG